MNDGPRGPERERQILHLLERALALPVDQQAAFLTRSCGRDTELRDEVTRLLRTPAERRALPAIAVTAAELLQVPAGHPERFGSYRILHLIDSGAMARVYAAEQDRTQRVVALKILRPELLTPRMIQRFEFEARLLARLRHPAIAQIIEARVADTDQGPTPFLALEMVEGERLDDFVFDRQPEPAARLELFLQICAGVHHAHQKSVIHCDLKPANIVVEAGRARILDFGIARTLDTEAPAERMGTPRYMAPEQQESGEADARTDVYALGVILRQLLVPRDEEGTVLPEDLAAIITRATAEHPEQRYQSAAELAADIRRFVDHYPVHAYPGGQRYELGKYYQRHRMLVQLAIAAALLGAAALIITTQLWRRARFAEQQARAALESEASARDLAEREAEFLARFFGAADPFGRHGPDLTVAAALSEAAEQVEQYFADDPLTCASLQLSIGRALMNLGLFAPAEAPLRCAYRTRHHLLGERHLDTVVAMEELAVSLRDQSKLGEAQPLLERSLAAHQRDRGPQDPVTLRSAGNLAQLLLDQGDYARARELARATLAGQQQALGDEHLDTGITRETLASIHYELGDFESAERLFRRQRELFLRQLGPADARTILTTNSLIAVLPETGKIPEALELGEGLIETCRQALGPAHPYALHATGNLATALFRAGQRYRAEQLYRDAVREFDEVLGPEHILTLRAVHSLAAFLGLCDRYTEAEELFAATLERQRLTLGDDHPDTLLTMNDLASTCSRLGLLEDAWILQEECCDHWRERGELDHPYAVQAHRFLDQLGEQLAR